MDRSDSGTCQHCNRQLRHHRHVDGNDVADTDPLPFQHVGKLANLCVKFAIGKRSHIARFAFPDERGAVGDLRLQMHIQTVVRHVGLTAHEPFGVWLVPNQAFLEVLEPVQFFASQFRPKGNRIRFRSIVEFFVSPHRIDTGIRHKFGTWRKQTVFVQDVVDLVHEVEFGFVGKISFK